jgi:hypothetical protein
MAFQVSPGIQVKEVDLTNVVPAVSSTTGAFAGNFRWGPVDEVVTITSESLLAETFGAPANTNASAEEFFSAAGFLNYANDLRVVRIATTNLFSANSAGATTSLLKNATQYSESYRDGDLNATVGAWTARYAGALGNSLKVSVCASSNAYSEDNVDTTTANNAVGATSVTSVSDADANFLVGDKIWFAGDDSQKYEVTAVAATSLTFKAIGQPANTGLVSAVDGSSVAVNISREWEFADQFDRAPGTSAQATAAGTSNDQMHIVVVDEDGSISGTQDTILEKYAFVSKASDATDTFGSSNYYRDVVERSSEYIWWTGHDTDIVSGAAEERTFSASVSSAFGVPDLPQNSSLSGGQDGRVPTAGQKYGAWQSFFRDGDSIDVSFLIVGSSHTDNGSGSEQDILTDWTTLTNQAILVTENRLDCIAFVSPRRSDCVNVTESTATTNIKASADTASSSSYAFMDANWLYIYDKYNDRYVWVPANGHTAGLAARSDTLRDPWFSPAGFSRGQYLGVTKLAYNPQKANRDTLYKARINPVVTFPGQGTVLFGDKTMLTVPSAFDRINVRRLFIVLEKAISTAAKAQLFEFNDPFTRASFRSAVEPFLREVQSRRGIYDFAVVCDETNNTDAVIDGNQFVASIFIKPARSINFITLNFVAARSGVEFEEIYGAV